jgi:hypothetical protein
MKKLILFLLILLSVNLVFAQRKVGSVATPYSITGWDAPYGVTPTHGFYIFTLMTNPGGYINLNTLHYSQLFDSLIVFTDLKQLWIVNDTLHFSDTLSYQGAFDTTSQYDTVIVPGADSLDVAVISIREDIPTANDILSIKIIDNAIIAQRPASGTSGLKYNWIWIRKYQ